MEMPLSTLSRAYPAYIQLRASFNASFVAVVGHCFRYYIVSQSSPFKHFVSQESVSKSKVLIDPAGQANILCLVLCRQAPDTSPHEASRDSVILIEEPPP